ncbi:IS1 transposase [Escherichia coli]|uniref:IS1 transposase n=1 Tax=Escherichia coli TaxID=562 RepID=A0A377K132_ECOLX|nr:IS1 transposase [Escherichia coli]
MASISIRCPSCSATEGVVRNGKSTAGHQRYLCSHCRKTWQLQFTYTASQPGTHQKIIDMAMNGVGCRASARIMGVGLNTVLRHLKNSGRSPVTSRIQPGSDVIVCAEMDEQWATSVLNHVSAGCFTRMTGYGGRLWRTSSVNALWPHWSVF